MIPRCFFFYGTLITGSALSLAQKKAHAKLQPLGPASVNGQLFGIPDPQGWYPALLPGQGVVRGWLYEKSAEFGAPEVAALDLYEEFDPVGREASLYRRVALTATLAGGGQADADVYLFNQPLPAGARRIEGGDFGAWLVQNDLAPYLPREDELPG